MGTLTSPSLLGVGIVQPPLVVCDPPLLFKHVSLSALLMSDRNASIYRFHPSALLLGYQSLSLTIYTVVARPASFAGRINLLLSILLVLRSVPIYRHMISILYTR